MGTCAEDAAQEQDAGVVDWRLVALRSFFVSKEVLPGYFSFKSQPGSIYKCSSPSLEAASLVGIDGLLLSGMSGRWSPS